MQSQSPQVPSFCTKKHHSGWLSLYRNSSLGPPQISLSFLLFALFFLFLEIRLWNWTNYSRLRGCFTWGAQLFSFFLMPWPTFVFKYQPRLLCISTMPTALQTSKGRKIRTHPNDASQVTVKGSSKRTSPHFLNTPSLSELSLPPKRMFPKDSSNSDPTRPEKV